MIVENLAVPVAGILAVSQLARLHIQGVSRNLQNLLFMYWNEDFLFVNLFYDSVTSK